MKKNIKDNRGYNQIWRKTKATQVRAARRSNRTISQMDTKRKIAILEIGCGTGLHAYMIAKKNQNIKVVGTDICKPFVKQAKKDFKLKNLRYEILDFNNEKAVRAILAKEGEFDYIFGDGILHHLFFQLDNAVSQLNKLLKRGGKIIFWEPNIYNPYCFLIFKFKSLRKKADLEPGELAFSKKHIRNILLTGGFEQIKVTYEDFLLPNTPDYLINFSIKTGNLIEKIPVANRLSQSIFIVAKKVKQSRLT